MKKTITWRDDDLSVTTKLADFKKIHSLFIKYKVPHTVTLICKDFDKNKSLVKYLKDSKIDVQIHAWDHFDYPKNIEQVKKDLPKCVAMVSNVFSKRPTTLYPPWNLSSPELEKVAKENGLTVSNKKISLSQYLRGVEGEVINFHGWSDECKDLEAALIKYTNA